MRIRCKLVAIGLRIATASAAAEEKPIAPLSPEQQLIQAAFDLDLDKVKELIAGKVTVERTIVGGLTVFQKK